MNEERIATALEFVRRAELYMDSFIGDAVPKRGMEAFIFDIRASLDGEEDFSLDLVMKEWRADKEAQDTE